MHQQVLNTSLTPFSKVTHAQAKSSTSVALRLSFQVLFTLKVLDTIPDTATGLGCPMR